MIHNHIPIIGIINAPFLSQFFSSCTGRGAYLNTTQQLPLLRKPAVPALPKNAPSGCIFACEWGKDRRDTPDGNLHRKIESFVNMAAEIGGRNGRGGMVHGVRSLGSATLDLAYVAMGAVDIWWEGGCWEWYVVLYIDSLIASNSWLEQGRSRRNRNTPRSRGINNNGESTGRLRNSADTRRCLGESALSCY